MIVTPEIERLTLPAEQELIQDLGEALETPGFGPAPPYRPDLPHHNYRRIYEEVLPEGLRLDARDPKNSTVPRRSVLIAGLMTGGMWEHVPLEKAEGFQTKQSRAAQLAGPLLLEFFSEADTEAVQAVIVAGEPGAQCQTPNQRKARRANVSYLGIRNTSPFLGATVRIFHEEVILSQEAGEEPPRWKTFVRRQYELLSVLISEDLSVSTERPLYGKGPFNRLAETNVSLLGSKRAVSNPPEFVSRYGQYVKKVVPEFPEIEPHIKRQAAA